MLRCSFPSQWKQVRLEKVAAIQTGIAKGNKTSGATLRLPYLRVANVQDGHLDLSAIKYIDVPQDKVNRYLLRKDDVLLTEGGDFDKLGRGTIWREQLPQCVHQNHIFVVRMNSKHLLPLYLEYIVNSHIGRTYFLACSKQTTNLASINSTQLKHMPLALPPLPEQQKIAAILGTWDAAIEKTGHLIEAKKKLKKALCQQLLTGKKRFKEFTDQWETIRLGKLFKERTETGYDHLPLLSITGNDGITNRDDLERRDTSNTDKSKYLWICPDDIGYNTMRMWQGVSAVSQLEGIVSPAYTVCIPDKKRVDPQFMGYLFKFYPIVFFFYRHSQGMVSDTWNLRFRHFAEIKVTIPSLAEQKRVASVLNACDTEIASLQSKLDAFQRQKKGLMQKLLTGKIRVKV